jgi:predicted ABC-type ATPase
MATQPRLRMLAGPNGSGKTTLKKQLPQHLLGVDINADEIEAQWRSTGELDLRAFDARLSATDLIRWLPASPLISATGLHEHARELRAAGTVVHLGDVEINSYLAAAVADFIRRALVELAVNFTFETVMSSPDKIDFLETSRSAGYRNYLYYTALEPSDLCLARVANRVQLGGHDVPDEKILERYTRSLDLLLSAIAQTSRAYIFDNSGAEHLWIAEVTDGITFDIKVDTVPAWFQQYVLSKLA